MQLVQLTDDGFFAGVTTADQSPLEPGVYLIPRNALDIQPPASVPAGKLAKWQGGAWVMYDKPVDPSAQPTPTLTPAQQLAAWRSTASVSRFQAKAALSAAGLLTQVEAYMALPTTAVIAKLAWQDATEFKRESPTVLSMGALLGLSDAQLDQLFVTGATITA